MSLKITNHITEQLKASTDLAAKIYGDVAYRDTSGVKVTETEWRIYPVAIPAGTKYPYVAIVPDDTAPAYDTKDGSSDWDVDDVVVAVVARTYPEAIETAQMVREALECVAAQYDDLIVSSAEIHHIKQFYLQDPEAYSVEIHMEFESKDIESET